MSTTGLADGQGPGRKGPGGVPDFPSFDDRVPYLARLEDEERQALLARGRVVRYPAGTVVIRQSDPSSHVLLIQRGRVKVTAVSANGYVALLALRRPGDIVGESSALSGLPRSATVTALEACVCSALDRDGFLAYLQEYPSAHAKLSSLLVDRLRAGDRKTLELASLTVRERLAVLLLDLLRSHSRRTPQGMELTVALSKQELAGSVGASREAVTRLLGEMRRKGIVRTARRSVTVVRPDLLRRIAAGGLPAEPPPPRT
ncbi:Crp/Fnr family transcriptional regulator [Streptomyces sp. 7-21]|jgi:CRP/FNR family cyclic AMP-dependent transcriptional regulator|uniref:Crp/Fnr family transcriptional regulator n=1 Tax=Streptomyces sp. 7-21 TaxID=2802283 RepID=UPI00191F5DBF|nr:Crp/Fnr family transcriptional regulator [Streptomyces sp. 7-21]MBL1067745.1 Crp/Fnr family transcriptional regulator [Streptomyces sp. 7-21]